MTQHSVETKEVFVDFLAFLPVLDFQAGVAASLSGRYHPGIAVERCTRKVQLTYFFSFLSENVCQTRLLCSVEEQTGIILGVSLVFLAQKVPGGVFGKRG